MVLRVRIYETPDHALILGVVLSRLILEEFDAALAQRERDLDPFLSKDEILWTRKDVRNDPKVSEGFVGVFDFRAHRFACPFASSLPQKSGSPCRGT